MKYHHVFLLAIVLALSSCGPKGEVVTPPEGLEQSVKEHLAAMDKSLDFTMTGMSVRAYPNEVYYVMADVDIYRKPNTTLNETNARTFLFKRNKALIAQRGFQNGQRYWQISAADKENMRILGIKPE